MAIFDEHAYKITVLNAMKDALQKGMKDRTISLVDGAGVVELLKESARMELKPPEVRTIVQKMALAYPIFKTIPGHPSYLDDENNTLAALYEKLADNLVPPEIRPSIESQPETKEFTRVFPEPVTVRYDDSGIFVLYNRGTIEAGNLEYDLKKQGWVLDEPIEAHDLIKANRVRITERSRRYWTGDAVTVRFRR